MLGGYVVTEKATLSLSNGANRQNSEGIRDEGHLFITSILQKRLNVNRLDEIFYQKNENFDQDRYKNRNSMSSGGSNSSNISPRNNTVSNNSISQKSKKSTDNSKKIADDDRNQYSYTSRKDSVDNYTEKQYNDFGWVRDNDVINAGYWKNFTENFAQAVNHPHNDKYSTTPNGAYIIPIYDANLNDIDAVIDTIVVAEGTIDSPVVLKVIKINASHDIDMKVREIDEAERRGIYTKTSELQNVYYSTNFRHQRYDHGKSYENDGNNVELGVYRGRSSKTSKRIKELKIKTCRFRK